MRAEDRPDPSDNSRDVVIFEHQDHAAGVASTGLLFTRTIRGSFLAPKNVPPRETFESPLK